MKLLQISDTHLGITPAKTLDKMFADIAKEEFDVLVHCGDWSGGHNGWAPVKKTVKMLRKHLPIAKVLVSLGNHDVWCRPSSNRPSTITSYNNNLQKIKDTFKENNIHWMGKDGNYTHPNFPHIVFTGSMGWYTNPNPPTNDINFLPPFLSGGIHSHLLTEANAELQAGLDQLGDFDKTWQTLVFISHFPVINLGRDWKGRFEDFSWSESIGRMLKEHYGCKYFLNGHAHQLHKGNMGRYECGSDYYNPKYQIIEVV